MCTFYPCGKKGLYESVRASFSARKKASEREKEEGSLRFRWRLLTKGVGGKERRREVLDQVGSPCAVRASGTPKRFWLWSKYGPSGPLPAPGHTNPRPSHISLLFSWLQNASGYQIRWGAFFFPFNIYS